MSVLLSYLLALQLIACCGLALRECLRGELADRLVMAGVAALFALLSWGALVGL